MKKMKKLLAMLLALAMVMGMSLTTFAANVPDGTQTTPASVYGVETGAVVKAYQIVEGKYNENGLVDYVAVDGVTIANPKAPTSSEITTISKNVASLNSETMTEGTDDDGNVVYTANLEAGYWIVLVTDNATALVDVYNPMLLGVWYSVGGSNVTMTFDPVSADDNWELVTKDVYAKSSTLTITKDVDDHEAEVVNDTVNFTVETNIPSYSAQYTDITYTITDTIVNGLSYSVDADGNYIDPVVKVAGTTLTKGTHYTVEFAEDGQSFVITFVDSYVLGLAAVGTNRDVVVTYSATLTNSAIANVAQNKVELEYTTEPNETSKKEDVEYVYTFEIDGILKKVGEGDDANGLTGAEFTLYKTRTQNDDGTYTYSDAFGTCTTSADRAYDIEFAGLDSDRTYYLKETKAPDSYSINDTVYTITFGDLTYDADGVLVSYKVYVDGTERGTITYGGEVAAPTVTVTNTKISGLPSTGGIGTAIFTIGGCAIMIAAAYFFFVSRKKEA